MTHQTTLHPSQGLWHSKRKKWEKLLIFFIYFIIFFNHLKNNKIIIIVSTTHEVILKFQRKSSLFPTKRGHGSQGHSVCFSLPIKIFPFAIPFTIFPMSAATVDMFIFFLLFVLLLTILYFFHGWRILRPQTRLLLFLYFFLESAKEILNLL